MKRISASLFLSFFVATAAFGKGICLQPNGNIHGRYVFQNVHVPKAGKTSAASGVFLFANGDVKMAAPFSGTIYHEATADKLLVGLLGHALVGGGHNFTINWEADPRTFEGTGLVDSDGDYTVDPGDPTVLTNVSCKTADFP